MTWPTPRSLWSVVYWAQVISCPSPGGGHQALKVIAKSLTPHTVFKSLHGAETRRSN
ncbi:hypothetical protein PR003_g15033 [Phytophthora rubi]|uniref:Uncharacterized protein n=1 Tax=Phytophthora rubi TaxID=129364 RepID=A0A6A4F368_9STRA|nr:hypothetical protein PR002_g14478 [Phytophthora rubi]KAE9331390.1 hypothetical protein PR003_g15033 [Phytophthora rubi]